MKKITFIASLALLVCSCSKVNDNTIIDENLMNFNAVYPSLTRATSTQFENGDNIGVYAVEYVNGESCPLQLSGNYSTNAEYTYNSAVWSSDTPIRWSEDGKFDIYAYYPYSSPSSIDNQNFSVSLDQSSPKTDDLLGGYESSDFLWCKVSGIEKQSVVPLQFAHRMSKVSINLVKGADYNGELPDDAVVVVHSTVPTATIDYATGVVTKHPKAAAESIITNKVSTSSFEAIVVPQRIDSKVPLIEIIAGGVSYLVESKFVFKAGVQHTVNIEISDNPDKIKIEIGGEVEGDWE